MLAKELTGVGYNKTRHRRELMSKLNSRSAASIEFKHANITAVLLDLEFPGIVGYKRRSNYQALLAEVVAEELATNEEIHRFAATSTESPIALPEVENILEVLTSRPAPRSVDRSIVVDIRDHAYRQINYLEREARNRSLGRAGEAFVLNFERARLIKAGKESLADRIEHTSAQRGDGAGYDILSFEANGKERLVEVKTTKYGKDTPFYLSRNEVRVSQSHAEQYHIYRLFKFARGPGLFILPGAADQTCELSPENYLARAR